MTADIAGLRDAFKRQYGREPELISEAPGRVNLIGEHTDYNGGFVLPVAIDRTVAVAVGHRDDGLIRAYSLDYGQQDEFPAAKVRRFAGTPGGWRDYLRGVVWALQDSFIEVAGVDVAISGDVPQGAGLSSSAAIEVAVAGALTSGLDLESLALICQKAENMFVGVQCGIMDQLTSATGPEGCALVIDCQSLEIREVPLPDDLAIVVIDSKVERRLADTAYNSRREECAEAARALGVETLRDATEGMLVALPGGLLKRARHVVTENLRVLSMVERLEAGDLARAGQRMAESHASLRDDFEVSVPQLDALVEIAYDNGAVGSRMTGAGFGGCTVNLVLREHVEQFADAVRAAYKARTGIEADAYVCRAVDGLRVTRG